MTQNFQEQVQNLIDLNLQLRRQFETAESLAESANDIIHRLWQCGLIERKVIFGRPFLSGSYTRRDALQDSGWLLQGAVGVGYGGIGFVGWDTEQFYAFANCYQTSENEAVLNFTAFDRCSPAIKGLLLPQFKLLMDRVCSLIQIG